MAPVASFLASKLNLWGKIDDSFTTDGKIVVCLAYNKIIGCSTKSRLEQYVRSAQNKKNKKLSSSKQQVLLTQMQQFST
jgi:hypothetical protein